MSNLGIKSQLWLDLLDEFKIKPWWESIRSYCAAVSMAMALLMIFMTYPKLDLTCLPLINETLPADFRRLEFSQPQAAFTNSYCGKQMPIWARYSGMFALAAAIGVAVLGDLWHYSPNVVSSFRAFTDAEEIIDGLHLSTKNMERILDGNDTDEKVIRDQVDKAKRLLTEYKCPITIKLWYIFRNIKLFIFTVMALAWSVVLLYFLHRCLDQIRCNFTPNSYPTDIDDWDKNLLSETEVDNMVQALGGYSSFFCVYTNAKQELPFCIILATSFAIQVLCVLVGICKVHTFGGTKQGKPRQFAEFMLIFWENACPVSAEGFGDFVRLVFPHNAFANANLNGEDDDPLLEQCVVIP